MAKRHLWQAGWFPGLLITFIFLVLGWTGLMSTLEWSAYGVGAKLSPRPDPGNTLEIIAIDQASLDQLGQWPWPRSYLGVVINKLSEQGARVIGVDLPLHTPQSEFGVRRLDTMRDAYGGKYQDTVKDILFLARQRLDTDGALANSLKKSDNIVLTISHGLGNVAVKGSPALSQDSFESFALADLPARPDAYLRYVPSVLNAGIPKLKQAQAPIAKFARHAYAGMQDESIGAGGRLVTPLVLKYDGRYYPSFSLVFTARSLALDPQAIRIGPSEDIRLGNTVLDTDASLRAYPHLYKSGAFRVHSFDDVYNDRTDPAQFADRDVLIGITAPGLVDKVSLPDGSQLPPVLVTAQQISNLLQGDLYRVPPWALIAQMSALLVVALYLVLVLPRMAVLVGVITSLLLLFVLVTAGLALMIIEGSWIPLMLPASTLACGAVVIAITRMIEDAHHRTRADLFESNLSLGQHLHAQGQLDQAFEKYRECPVDDTLLDRVYSLGLDYERRRQFSKAEMVFAYIEQHRSGYRDAGQRVQKNREVQNMVILPNGGKHTAQGTLILSEPGLQKPVLGRYEILEEIGQGAMGRVYLGRDPRIGRTVAIKTMVLSEEFEDDEVDSIRKRFLREAETAGRLSHPNIVTIYDVGEEQDLTYIAMDYIKGRDLSAHKSQGSLLPLDVVMDIAIQVATALDYAHNHDVVHRDIKPANIIYDDTSGIAKVTDFGVACLTSSSKTKTGTMLGSPAYMSPEQANGNKVDGASDLFSLGSTLYQLTTGRLPFNADSVAGMTHKICNEKQPDVRRIREDIPECLGRVINRAMQKQKENRYSSGAQMAKALRQCRSKAAQAD